jgi:hypothetical protein
MLDITGKPPNSVVKKRTRWKKNWMKDSDHVLNFVIRIFSTAAQRPALTAAL